MFSHWTRTLDYFEKALECRRMHYVRIDGSLTVEQRRTVIHQFNTVPETRILLLSYGSGSVGYAASCSTKWSRLTLCRLNLEAATHVHLLEPHWNPMVEAQAAARVDRLDQMKDVYIYRYIVKKSIEEVCSRHSIPLWKRADVTGQNIRNAQRMKLKDVELSVSSMATGEDSSTGSSFRVSL